MPVTDARTARVVATVLLFAAALAFLYGARRTIIAFIFAIFFAYLVEPLVSKVQDLVHGRGKALAITYLGIALALVLIGLFAGPKLVREGTRLAHSFPEFYEKLASGQIAWTIGGQHGWSAETKTKIQNFLQSHREQILTWAAHFGSRLAGLLSNAWILALIPILGAFFLKDGRRFADAAVDLVSRHRQREFIESVLKDVNVMLAHFIRAQLILAILSMAFYTIVLLALHVSFGAVMGVLGGAMEFIPIVGPLVAAVMILGVALVTGYHHVLILGLLLGAWRVVQDYVNSPRIMGRHVELHPLATLFGVLCGAEIAGVIGVYLSVPIMATLRILWRHWRAYLEGPNLITPSEAAEVPPGENVA